MTGSCVLREILRAVWAGPHVLCSKLVSAVVAMLRRGAVAASAAVATAAAAHTLWLRGTFTSRLEAATQAQAGRTQAGQMQAGPAQAGVSAAALAVKHRLERGASVVVLSGSGSAEAAAALAADPSLAAIRVLLRGSLRRALDECHLPPVPSSALAAAIARLEGRCSLEAALEVAGAASERGGLLLCLSQEQLMEEGVARSNPKPTPTPTRKPTTLMPEPEPQPEPQPHPHPPPHPPPHPDQEGVAAFVRTLASRPGCSACIVADATLYAAEHCEQLLGAPEVVISHCKAALPSTVGEIAACVGQQLPCCEGRGAACAAAAAAWVAKHVGGHRDDIAALRAELELEASREAAGDADAGGSADADADGSEAGGAAGAAEAGAAEARGELSARLEVRLEAGRRRLVGLRARQLARLLGLPPPAEAAPAFASERAIGAAGVAGATGAVGPTFASEVAEAEEVAPCGSWVWPWLAELSSTEPRLGGMTEALAEMEAQVELRRVGGARAALAELLLRMAGGEEVTALDS